MPTHAAGAVERRVGGSAEGEPVRREVRGRGRSGSGDTAARRHDRRPSVHRRPAPPTHSFRAGPGSTRRQLELPADAAGSSVFLEFEGVYRDARVFVNGTLAAHRPSGYSDFVVEVDHLLRFGEPNELRVEARSHDDSRWYAGAGIYRSVWLLRAGRVHLSPGHLQVLCPRHRRTGGGGRGLGGGPQPLDRWIIRGSPYRAGGR